jgi:hypothetical protein
MCRAPDRNDRHARGYTGVYLNGQGARIRRYHEVIDDYIDGRRPGRRRALAAE